MKSLGRRLLWFLPLWVFWGLESTFGQRLGSWHHPLVYAAMASIPIFMLGFFMGKVFWWDVLIFGFGFIGMQVVWDATWRSTL